MLRVGCMDVWVPCCSEAAYNATDRPLTPHNMGGSFYLVNAPWTVQVTQLEL